MTPKNLFSQLNAVRFLTRRFSSAGFTSILTLLILAATALPTTSFIAKTFNIPNLTSTSTRIASAVGNYDEDLGGWIRKEVGDSGSGIGAQRKRCEGTVIKDGLGYSFDCTTVGADICKRKRSVTYCIDTHTPQSSTVNPAATSMTVSVRVSNPTNRSYSHIKITVNDTATQLQLTPATLLPANSSNAYFATFNNLPSSERQIEIIATNDTGTTVGRRLVTADQTQLVISTTLVIDAYSGDPPTQNLCEYSANGNRDTSYKCASNCGPLGIGWTETPGLNSQCLNTSGGSLCCHYQGPAGASPVAQPAPQIPAQPAVPGAGGAGGSGTNAGTEGPSAPVGGAAPPAPLRGSVLATEVCGGHNGIDRTLLNGYLYPICSKATIPTEVTLQNSAGRAAIENGIYEYSKANSPDKPFCGATGYDVYRCKDGTLVTDNLGALACDNQLWCPTSSNTAPGGGPPPPAAPTPACTASNLAERAACNPSCSTSQCGSSGTNLGCVRSRTSATQFFCCPGNTQFCAATNTCISSSTACAINTPTPLPTGQQQYGCQNPDVCAPNNTGQPTNGVSGTTYRIKPNGHPACAAYYVTPQRPYCWEVQPAAPTIGTGGIAGDGTVCPNTQFCHDHPPYLNGAGNRVCDIGWDGPLNTTTEKYCCNFASRWCTLTNSCLSVHADCVAPTAPPPQTYSCITKDGWCVPGSATSRCCTRNDHPNLPADLSCTQTSAGIHSCQYGAQPAAPQQPAPPQTPATPDYHASGTCASTYFTCVAAGACPAARLSQTRPEDNAACAAAGAEVAGPICCLKPEFASATSNTNSSIASVENVCTLNSECVRAKTGNACVYYGSTGICQAL